jgi:hypothetical protein
MRDNGLVARQRRRFKKTTDSNHGGPIALNHPDQDFATPAPDQKWAADISLDHRRLALSRHYPRPFLAPNRRLGGQRPPEKRSGAFRPAAGARLAPAKGGSFASL